MNITTDKKIVLVDGEGRPHEEIAAEYLRLFEVYCLPMRDMAIMLDCSVRFIQKDVLQHLERLLVNTAARGMIGLALREKAVEVDSDRVGLAKYRVLVKPVSFREWLANNTEIHVSHRSLSFSHLPEDVRATAARAAENAAEASPGVMVRMAIRRATRLRKQDKSLPAVVPVKPDNSNPVPDRLVSLKTIKTQLNHRYDQQTQQEIYSLGLTKYKIGKLARYDADQFNKNLNNSQNIQIPVGISYDEIRKALESLQ